MKCRYCATPLTNTFPSALHRHLTPKLTAADLMRPEKYYPLKVKVCDIVTVVPQIELT
jgi:hypothetical protein